MIRIFRAAFARSARSDASPEYSGNEVFGVFPSPRSGRQHKALSLPTFLGPSNLPPLALKGPWILAGGETTGSRQPPLRALARAPDVTGACGIVPGQTPVRRPCQGAKAIITGFPVVSPPANLRCASGAKRKNVGNDKALCCRLLRRLKSELIKHALRVPMTGYKS